MPVSLQWRCAGLARALLQAPGAVGTEAQGAKPRADLSQINLSLSQDLFSSEDKPVLLVNFPAQAEIHSGTCPHLTSVITEGS